MKDLDIGISKENRENVVKLLQQGLADEHVLYIKMRNFHWNLVGPRFHTLHEFYEKQYTAVAMSIDEIAERIRQLGGIAHGSMKQFLEQSRLDEHPGELMDGDDTIVILTEDNEKIIRTLRQDIKAIEEDYGDVGTADFLTAKLGEHEEMAWMLRSFMRKSDIQS